MADTKKEAKTQKALNKLKKQLLIDEKYTIPENEVGGRRLRSSLTKTPTTNVPPKKTYGNSKKKDIKSEAKVVPTTPKKIDSPANTKPPLKQCPKNEINIKSTVRSSPREYKKVSNYLVNLAKENKPESAILIRNCSLTDSTKSPVSSKPKISNVPEIIPQFNLPQSITVSKYRENEAIKQTVPNKVVVKRVEPPTAALKSYRPAPVTEKILNVDQKKMTTLKKPEPKTKNEKVFVNQNNASSSLGRAVVPKKVFNSTGILERRKPVQQSSEPSVFKKVVTKPPATTKTETLTIKKTETQRDSKKADIATRDSKKSDTRGIKKTEVHSRDIKKAETHTRVLKKVEVQSRPIAKPKEREVSFDKICISDDDFSEPETKRARFSTENIILGYNNLGKEAIDYDDLIEVCSNPSEDIFQLETEIVLDTHVDAVNKLNSNKNIKMEKIQSQCNNPKIYTQSSTSKNSVPNKVNKPLEQPLDLSISSSLKASQKHKLPTENTVLHKKYCQSSQQGEPEQEHLFKKRIYALNSNKAAQVSTLKSIVNNKQTMQIEPAHYSKIASSEKPNPLLKSGDCEQVEIIDENLKSKHEEKQKQDIKNDAVVPIPNDHFENADNNTVYMDIEKSDVNDNSAVVVDKSEVNVQVPDQVLVDSCLNIMNRKDRKMLSKDKMPEILLQSKKKSYSSKDINGEKPKWKYSKATLSQDYLFSNIEFKNQDLIQPIVSNKKLSSQKGPDNKNGISPTISLSQPLSNSIKNLNIDKIKSMNSPQNQINKSLKVQTLNLNKIEEEKKNLSPPETNNIEIIPIISDANNTVVQNETQNETQIDSTTADNSNVDTLLTNVAKESSVLDVPVCSNDLIDEAPVCCVKDTVETAPAQFTLDFSNFGKDNKFHIRIINNKIVSPIVSNAQVQPPPPKEITESTPDPVFQNIAENVISNTPIPPEVAKPKPKNRRIVDPDLNELEINLPDTIVPPCREYLDDLKATLIAFRSRITLFEVDDDPNIYVELNNKGSQTNTKGTFNIMEQMFLKPISEKTKADKRKQELRMRERFTCTPQKPVKIHLKNVSVTQPVKPRNKKYSLSQPVAARRGMFTQPQPKRSNISSVMTCSQQIVGADGNNNNRSHHQTVTLAKPETQPVEMKQFVLNPVTNQQDVFQQLFPNSTQPNNGNIFSQASFIPTSNGNSSFLQFSHNGVQDIAKPVNTNASSSEINSEQMLLDRLMRDVAESSTATINHNSFDMNSGDLVVPNNEITFANNSYEMQHNASADGTFNNFVNLEYLGPNNDFQIGTALGNEILYLDNDESGNNTISQPLPSFNSIAVNNNGVTNNNNTLNTSNNLGQSNTVGQESWFNQDYNFYLSSNNETVAGDNNYNSNNQDTPFFISAGNGLSMYPHLDETSQLSDITLDRSELEELQELHQRGYSLMSSEDIITDSFM